MIGRLLGGLALAIGLSVPPLAWAATPGTTGPGVSAAIVTTMTGPQGLMGQDLVDGFNLALKQQGARVANQEIQVKVIEDRGSPDVAQRVVKRLLDRDKPNFVIVALSRGSLAAVMPMLTAAKVFVLNLAPAPVTVAGADCSQWFFDLAGQADGVHEAAGVQMNADQVKRLAVVAPDNPLAKDAVTALRRTYSGEIVATVNPKEGATGFADEMAKIRDARADGIYDLLTGGVNAQFTRAWAGSGLKTQARLYAPWTAFERSHLQAMADSALGAVNIGTWAPDLDNPVNKRFVTDFEAEYGRPVSTWAVHGFDAVHLIDAALKTTSGRTSDPDMLRQGFRKAEFQSVRGNFRFNTNHFPILSYYSRKVGKDAKGRFTNESSTVAVRDWRDRLAGQCPMRWVDPTPPPVTAAKKKP